MLDLRVGINFPHTIIETLMSKANGELKLIDVYDTNALQDLIFLF